MLSANSMFQQNVSKYMVSGKLLNEVQKKKVDELNLEEGTHVFFFKDELIASDKNEKNVRIALKNYCKEYVSSGADISNDTIWGALGSRLREERLPNVSVVASISKQSQR